MSVNLIDEFGDMPELEGRVGVRGKSLVVNFSRVLVSALSRASPPRHQQAVMNGERVSTKRRALRR